MIWKANAQDRQPAVAGQFYPADTTVLRQEVERYFALAKKKETENVRAVISPHAGYVFSGVVAASSYNQLDPDKKYKNIFIIGTSHHVYLKGASVYTAGDYIMPWGKVKVNTQIAKSLTGKYSFFEYEPQAHTQEHSLEVQLPFLHYKLKHDFEIVPIIIGTNNLGTLDKIAEALKPYFNEENLFVISTDFSHYPPYEQAKENDLRTAQAIVSKDPEKFIRTIEENKRRGIPNLATSICGWSATYVLMKLAEDNDNLKFKIIDYKNSGDSPYGGKDRVVGYYSIVLYQEEKKEDEFSLSEEDKKTLLKLSRETLESYIYNGERPQIDTSGFSDALKTEAGAFVTLKKDGKLRGCIGRFMPSQPLWEVVVDMTIAAATEDPRFPKVTPDEVPQIKIEISVLTPLKRIYSIDEVIVGKHGIYCRKGWQSGTLLPQVATEQNWDAKTFVEYCCKYKAGLNKDCWKDAELYTYEAIVFEE